MKITFRLIQVFLPVFGLCAVMAGTAAAHTIIPMTSARQNVQSVSHTVRPNDIPAHITSDSANLYVCLPNGAQSCSIISQLTPSDNITVHCEVPGGNGEWWSYVNTEYGPGWVSNAYISGGPGAIRGVSACPQQQ